jgi:hypothetical protein
MEASARLDVLLRADSVSDAKLFGRCQCIASMNGCCLSSAILSKSIFNSVAC